MHIVQINPHRRARAHTHTIFKKKTKNLTRAPTHFINVQRAAYPPQLTLQALGQVHGADKLLCDVKGAQATQFLLPEQL